MASRPVFHSLSSHLEFYYNYLKHPTPELAADDSDDELALEEDQYPIVTHRAPISSAQTTIESSYCGKRVPIKGNQLIVWARNIMEKTICVPDRDERIHSALTTRTAAIHSSDDWIRYEGMFDAFGHLLAKETPPFRGILTIFIDPHTTTTIEFKNRGNQQSSPLYAYVHDQELIGGLQERFPGAFTYPETFGLSYDKIIQVVERIKGESQTSDAELASRQLTLLRHSAQGPFSFADRFLSYFNAILFGSEASRNSLCFVTNILILDRIAQQQLTYATSFQTPSSSAIFEGRRVAYAAHPMASPHAGPGNFRAYKALTDYSALERDEMLLSSEIGMRASRERPLWTQIQVKEAILLKFWAKDWSQRPQWPGAETTILEGQYSAGSDGHAVEFARLFSEKIAGLLHNNFPSVARKTYVYSSDELQGIGKLPSSGSIWRDPLDPRSTQTTSDVMQSIATSIQPMAIEKEIETAMGDIIGEALGQLEEAIGD